MSLTSTTLELLRAHTPADALEREHHARMLKLVASGSDAFSRLSYSPGHFTASAFVVAPESDHVLLILHAKLGLWLQPGGHIDPTDDSLEAAARRELLEETGLEHVRSLQTTPLDLDIHVIPARGNVEAHEHFDVRFVYQASSTECNASSDALAAKWIPIDDLTGTDTDESVRRAVRKIAARKRESA